MLLAGCPFVDAPEVFGVPWSDEELVATSGQSVPAVPVDGEAWGVDVWEAAD